MQNPFLDILLLSRKSVFLLYNILVVVQYLNSKIHIEI